MKETKSRLLACEMVHLSPARAKSESVSENVKCKTDLNVNVIYLPTEHQGVHKKSFRNVRAFRNRFGIYKCRFLKKRGERFDGEESGAEEVRVLRASVSSSLFCREDRCETVFFRPTVKHPGPRICGEINW